MLEGRSEVCTKPILLVERQVRVPCGMCTECRSKYALSWALRCVHEAARHEDSCFVTLTYRDEKLPEYGTLVKKDLQDFFKRLRKSVEPKRLKYYAAGEYGERTGRPHYHALVFGHMFGDREMVKGGKYPLYRSPALEKLWPVGLSSCGTVSVESARYVAGYVMKKVDQVGRKKKYNVDATSGELVEIEGEFSIMSRGGRTGRGLGSSWIERYGNEVCRDDSVVQDGQEFRVPRYYDERIKERDAAAWEVMKLRRERKSSRYVATKELLAREVIARARLALMERSL